MTLVICFFLFHDRALVRFEAQTLLVLLSRPIVPANLNNRDDWEALP